MEFIKKPHVICTSAVDTELQGQNLVPRGEFSAQAGTRSRLRIGSRSVSEGSILKQAHSRVT